MTNAEDEGKQSLVLEVADNPVVADAVSPEVAQVRAFKPALICRSCGTAEAVP